MLINLFSKVKIPNTTKKSKFNLLFILFLVIYTLFIGRNRYQTISTFEIVGTDAFDFATSVDRSVLLPGSSNPSYQEAQSLEVFLKSPDTYKIVFEKLKNKYKTTFPDFMSGLKPKQTLESSYNFYKLQFTLIADESTGIIVLKSYGFDPHTSLELNKALIEQSNKFLDERSRNIYNYNVKFSKKELDSALEKLEDANKNLVDFKFVNGQLDETIESTAASNYLAELQKSLVEEKVKQAALVRSFSKQESPEISLSRSNISALEQEIKAEINRVSGSKDSGLAARAIKSAQLKSLVELQRENVSELLINLNQAKTNSSKKERFISILSSPFKATTPDNSWRLKTLLIVFACYLLLLGISKTIEDIR